jgi:hypothetical protein
MFPQKLTAIAVGILMMPTTAAAQDNAISPQNIIVPPPRTITAEIKQEKPSRTVDIHYHDDNMRSCVDSFKLEASTANIEVNQNVTFRLRIQRKCDNKSLKAPVPVSATFTTRATASKKNTPDNVQTIQPAGNTFAFSTRFTQTGSWQVSVVSAITNLEKHTVSFVIKVNAPAQQISE